MRHLRRSSELLTSALLCVICGNLLSDHPVHLAHLPEGPATSVPGNGPTAISSNSPVGTATAAVGPIWLSRS